MLFIKPDFLTPSGQSLTGLVTAPSKLHKVLFLALSVTFCFFCEQNISGTAEWISVTFTVKTCLVPRSYEFECQGQGHQGQKTLCTLTILWQQRNGMRLVQITLCSSSRWHHSVADGGGVISMACMWFVFGKTSVALVLFSLVFFMIAEQCLLHV